MKVSRYELAGFLIKQDPADFAEVMFPVMDPAIRKSINEALKAFTESTDYMLEQNMSVQGLKWRVEVWRKGIRYADLIIE